jgi:cyclomaltodextrin glucanotransferase
MPIWFWQEFVADIQAHKPSTFLFGEYGFGSPWDGRCVRYAKHSGISILGFGLCGAIRSAFSGQEPGGFHLIEQVLAMDPVYRRSTELVTFFENHDMPRFLSICPSHQDLELATVLLLTMRGIPCLFYGSEHYLADHTNGGNDPYNRPMMERWDVDTRQCTIIRCLAQLRKTNRALPYGRHIQQYVSDSIYAYTRRYRDNRVFVVINRGGEACIDIGQTDLPDGLHHCLLTDNPITVSDGAIRQLPLAAKEACVIAVQGPPLQATTVVKFQINNYITHPGEVMAVCGGAPELGSWDVDRCPTLEFINGDAWFAEVGFNESAGKAIRFKFVVLRENGQEPFYENLVCRSFLLPTSGSVKLDLDWDQL